MTKQIKSDLHDVRKSINESFNEVKLMRTGKVKKNSLDDLLKHIKQMQEEM